jgi:hypothetical protein
LSGHSQQTETDWLDSPEYTIECGDFNPRFIAPIHIDDHYTVYVQPDSTEGFLPNRLIFLDADGQEVATASYDPAETVYISEDLPVNQVYAVGFNDLCGNTRRFAEVTTSYAKGQYIEVSHELFEIIADISISGNSDIYNAFNTLAESSTANYYETAHYIQRYFLKGESVANIESLFRSEVVFRKESFMKSSDCNCEVVSTRWQALPGMNESSDSGIIPSSTNYMYGRDEFEYGMITSGPAKSWFAYSDGHRERRNRTYGGAIGQAADRGVNLDNVDDLTPDFNQRVHIRLNLFCNGGNPSASCGCRKRVDTYLAYESELTARAQTGSGGGTKEATAAGEDIAIAYTIERNGEPGGIFNLIAAGRQAIESSCGRRPNPEFYSDLASLVAGITRFVAPLVSGSQTVWDALEGEVLEELLQAGVDLSFTPSSIFTGNCGSNLTSTEPRRLIQEDIRLYIAPNTPKEIGIATRTRLLSSGMRSWQSEATHRSGYTIATVEKAGLESTRNSDPACCTDRTTTSYISKAVSGIDKDDEFVPTINSTWDLRREAAGWIIQESNHTFDFRNTCAAFSPTGACLSTGTATPFEYGKSNAHRRYDLNNCLIAVPVRPGNGGIPFPGVGERKFSKTENSRPQYDIVVFSTDGRRIGTSNSQTDQFIRANLSPDLANRLKPGMLYVAIIQDHESSAVVNVTKFIQR